MPCVRESERFTRRNRFSAQGSFGPILRSARRIRGVHAIVHAVPGEPRSSRLGVALTRRLTPSSVDRNWLKRMVRETFRRHPVKGIGVDVVVAFREKFHPRNSAAISREIRGLFDQLCAESGR